MKATNKIRMVVGSWGSYNEGNSKALGSKWIDLDDFDSWEEVAEELVKQGFELETIDEELFVQDIEGFFDVSINYDYTNPQQLFDLIKDSGILLDDNKYDLGEAVCEAIGFDEWSEFVNNHGEDWVDYFCLYDYSNSWNVERDFGIDQFKSEGIDLGYLENYFDFEAYGRDIISEGNYHTVSGGVLECCY